MEITNPISREEVIIMPTLETSTEAITRINPEVEDIPNMDKYTEVNPPTTWKEGRNKPLRISQLNQFRQSQRVNADVATKRGNGPGIVPRNPGNQSIEEATVSLITTLEGIPMLLEKKNMMQMTLRKILKNM